MTGRMDKGVRVLYISPEKIMFSTLTGNGGPVFKTQKDLAGRAIVADSFLKSEALKTTQPGDGFWGHKDGYNVLYGDWSAKWYGDPQQTFIWWNDTPYINAWGADGPEAYQGGNHNVITDYDNSPSYNPATYSALTTNTYNFGGVVYRWHLLDKAVGIDVGVDGQ